MLSTLMKDINKGVMEAKLVSPLGVGKRQQMCLSTKAISVEEGVQLVSKWILELIEWADEISRLDLRSPWRCLLRSEMISVVNEADETGEAFSDVK
jgi:hypothetical protein